jgi:hypothetical protein
VTEDIESRDHVTVRSWCDPGTWVRFSDWRLPDDYGLSFSIELHSHELRTRRGIEDWTWEQGEPADFLDRLVADFRGWEGERTWRVNDLALRAVFRSGGHVGLTWTLRSWNAEFDNWEASVTTCVEAGEQLSALAADVRHFFSRPDA